MVTPATTGEKRKRLTSCETDRDSERVGSGGGAATGDGAGSSRAMGAGAGAGAGAAAGGGAEVVLVGAGVGTEMGAEPAEIEPSSSETSLGAAFLPEKNSAAVRAGSAEGAGGKMSDWKESDCVAVSTCDGIRGVTTRTYFSGNNEGDGLD